VRNLNPERKLNAEIVQSATWFYDGLVPAEVWIVKQNFEYHYDVNTRAGDDNPEILYSVLKA